MRLLLIHGRFDPDETMNDWGFNGPDIMGIEAIHVTYQSTYVLWFRNHTYAWFAHLITGWPFFDDNALELVFHDDMLKTVCISADGPAMYFGDYEIQASA